MKSDSRHTFPKGNDYSNGRTGPNRDKISQMRIDQIGHENLDQIIKIQTDKALAGDDDACRYVLDKVYTKPTPNTFVSFTMRNIKTLDDIGEAQNDIMVSVASREISLEESERIFGLLEQRRKTLDTIEASETRKLIEKIDKRMNDAGIL